MKFLIRPAKFTDLDNFQKIRHWRLDKLHDYRLKQQANGDAEYLIAFLSDTPIGHLHVLFNEKHCHCPILEDLYVKQKFRGRGLARKIVNEATKRLKKMGFKTVAIDVEVDKKWLKSFYESLRFVASGQTRLLSWREKDSGKTASCRVYHLVKHFDT